MLLFLDWANACDRIKTDNMLAALHRLGLLADYVDMIRGICFARLFVIRDHTGASSERPQQDGIAQGCPLSPFLFYHRADGHAM